MKYYALYHGSDSYMLDLRGCVQYIIRTYGFSQTRFMELYDKIEHLLKTVGEARNDDLALRIVGFPYTKASTARMLS